MWLMDSGPVAIQDECIKPPPPGPDCTDIPCRNFSVVWNVLDPNQRHFGGDHDGIGCES
jgi:hypothetical protein